MTQPGRARGAAVRKSLLVLSSVAAVLLVLEVGLRLAGFWLMARQEHRNRGTLGTGGELRVLCLGESTTAYGGEHSYPSQLERILNQHGGGRSFSVINKGLPGANTNIILERLVANLDASRPEFVVTMMGVNDEYQQPSRYQDDHPATHLLKSLRVYKLLHSLQLNFSLFRRGTEYYSDPFLSLNRSNTLDEYFRENSRAVRDVVACYAQSPGPACDARQEAFLEAVPSEEVRLFLRGFIQESLGNLGRARHWYNRALELNPASDNIAMRQMRNLEQQAAGNHPPPRVTADNYMYVLIEYARDLKERGRCRDAEELLSQILAVSGDSFWVHLELGLCSMYLREFERAEQAFLTCVALRPDSHWGHGGLAMTYLQQGKRDLAFATFRKAHSLNYENFVATTKRNYLALKEIVLKRGATLVCVQYPVRSVTPLKRMVGADGAGRVLFVDNEASFTQAVAESGYEAIFTDNFAGDFGHCTPRGNRLLAENVARAILAQRTAHVPARP